MGQPLGVCSHPPARSSSRSAQDQEEGLPGWARPGQRRHEAPSRTGQCEAGRTSSSLRSSWRTCGKRRRKLPRVLFLGRWCSRGRGCSPACSRGRLPRGERLAPAAELLTALPLGVSLLSAPCTPWGCLPVPLLSHLPVGSANGKARERSEGGRGEGRVLLPTLPWLPGLSGRGFAVPTALTPPGRRPLLDAGCFWI